MRPLVLFALWIGLVAIIAGCQPCYENMGIIANQNPNLLIFNKCDGSVHLQGIPAPAPEHPDQSIPNLRDNNPKVES